MDFLFAVLGLCAFVLSTLAIIWLIIVMLKQFSSPKTWDGSMLGQPIEQSAHRPESGQQIGSRDPADAERLRCIAGKLLREQHDEQTAEAIAARSALTPQSAVQTRFVDHNTDFYELHSADYEEEQRFLQEGWTEEPGDGARHVVDDYQRELERQLAKQEAREQEEEFRMEMRRQLWSAGPGRTGAGFWVLGREPLHDHYDDGSSPNDDYEGDDFAMHLCEINLSEEDDL